MTILDKLYQSLAREFNLPVEQVARICRYQFSFTRQEFEDRESWETVRLPYWGSFKPMPDRLAKHKLRLERQANEPGTDLTISSTIVSRPDATEGR